MMRFGFKAINAVLATVLFGGIVLVTEPTVAASGEDVIKARLKLMKDDIYGHWKQLAAFAKKGKGSLSDVEKHARALATLALKIPGHFPKDTGRGNYPDEMTRSLPVIWTDWDKFETAVQRLVDGSNNLANVAQRGDKNAVVTLIGKKGWYSKTKIGCAECHEKFQGAKVKKKK